MGGMVEADEGKRGKERNVGKQRKRNAWMEQKERVHAIFFSLSHVRHSLLPNEKVHCATNALFGEY